ncbi:MAG: Fe-S cluster assembly ATPase SufC [Candidatus Micrarchaeota archaeon]|nr:Fe-S cluster assembly ATPase SufC [Candidatus Micrarchaeota archaeon]
MLELKNWKVGIEDKEIVHGVDLKIDGIHAIMGPNGSGKSTLAQSILGHPAYWTDGEIYFDGKDIKSLTTNERAMEGIFLSFQSPPYLEGIKLKELLKKIYYLRRGYDERDLSKYKEFMEELKKGLELLKLPPEFVEKEVNKDFSGGEKKKSEVLQMLMFKPRFAILDELDSGLDVDSLKVVSNAVLTLNIPLLIITHYNRILKYIKPDYVHVMKEGKIVKTGPASLAEEIEEEGYETPLSHL